MSEAFLPMLMAVLALLGILAGYRVGMVLAGTAALFVLASDLPFAFFNLLISRIYANVLSNWLLLILETSGVAERSLRAAYLPSWHYQDLKRPVSTSQVQLALLLHPAHWLF